VYGLDQIYGSAAVESHFSTFHEVYLTGLECGTTYQYRMISEAPDGSLDHSDSQSFTTYSCDPIVDDPSPRPPMAPRSR
jgi:hypothetical protein